MTAGITGDHHGSLRAIETIWSLAKLPSDSLSMLKLTGDHPSLPTSFQVGFAAHSSVASAALAATEIAYQRNGKLHSLSVDMSQAELECTGYFKLANKVPESWAPLSGLYPYKDGHVCIQANFEHHRDGALKILGLKKSATNYSKEDVSYAHSH